MHDSKQKRLISLSVLISLVLFGCAHDPVRNDLVDYLNDHILRIADLETMSLARYAMVTGKNYKNDETLIKTLNDYVIPQYGRFLSLLRKIHLSTPETRQLHQHYIEGATALYAGFRMLTLALEKQDSNLVKIANARINEGTIAINKWKEILFVLSKKHKVKVEK